jgi:peptidoglycan-associated lipoprotein
MKTLFFTNTGKIIFAFLIYIVLLSFFANKETIITYCVREIPLDSVENIDIKIGDFFILHNKNVNRYEYDTQFYPVLLFLNNNPNLIIELAAHTDPKGSRQFNDSLSNKQVQYVYNYLISNGVRSDRIIPVGKGETYPYYVYKDIIFNTQPFKGIEFKKGDILNERYIDNLNDWNKKVAALYLNRRIVITIINIL